MKHLLIEKNRFKGGVESGVVCIVLTYASCSIDAVEDAVCTQDPFIPQIQIRTEKTNNDWVKVLISDSGIGIPEFAKTKLFDLFFTTKPIGKGIGLGLSISSQIVIERHGGRLSCISSPEKGTGIIIEIPMYQYKVG